MQFEKRAAALLLFFCILMLVMQLGAIPTQSPTAMPTVSPTGQPTSQPSRRPTSQPSSRPTSQPSRRPTSQPSSRPTSQPSSRPTSQPSSQPTLKPSGQPSAQPSGRPTGQPSRHPTAQPSASPTGQPTTLPTSKPTDVNAPRVIDCGTGFALCEAQPTPAAANECKFNSFNVWVQCPESNNNTASCTFTGSNIAFYTDATFMTIGGCEIRFVSTRDGITLYPNATVIGNRISFDSKTFVSIQKGAIVDVRGGGDVVNVTNSDWGGSFGGSGGRAKCAITENGTISADNADSVYYSNVQTMVGDLDGISDSSAMGCSGGGGANAGLGGGRVVVQAPKYFELVKGAIITADGLLPKNLSLSGSSGSGGAIAINTTTFQNTLGILSAQGGHAASKGSAGGGGRITIYLPQSMYDSSSQVFINEANGVGMKIALHGTITSPVLLAFGGTSNRSNSTYVCLNGAAGTIVVQFVGDDHISGHVLVNGGDHFTQAATIVSLPQIQSTSIDNQAYRSLTARGLAIVTTTNDVFMPSGSLGAKPIPLPSSTLYGADTKNCEITSAENYQCSYFYLENSVLSLGVLEHSEDPVNHIVAADYIDVSGMSLVIGAKVQENLNVSSLIFNSSSASYILFFYNLGLSALYKTTVNCAILQASSQYLQSDGSGLNIISLGSQTSISSTTNIYIQGLIQVSGGVVIFASQVYLSASAHIAAPIGLTYCRQKEARLQCPGVNGTEFKAGGNGIAANSKFFPLPPTLSQVMNYGTVYISAINQVTFASSSLVEAPVIMVCSQSAVDIEFDANLVADGRGCAPNMGSTAGQAPYAETPGNTDDDFLDVIVYAHDTVPVQLMSGGGGGSNPGYNEPNYHGGYGGNGEDWASGGGTVPTLPHIYPKPGDTVSSGSGGGCGYRINDHIWENSSCSKTACLGHYSINVVGSNFNSTPSHGAGGGIIILYSAIIFTFNGGISAQGGVGGYTTNCKSPKSWGNESKEVVANGGGAGGTVIIIMPLLVGGGSIQINGGDAFSSKDNGDAYISDLPHVNFDEVISGGGGGGGGVAQLYDFTSFLQAISDNKYNFTGIIHSNGGKKTEIVNVNYEIIFGFGSNGIAGALAWPACEPGYGNTYTSCGNNGLEGVYCVTFICKQCPLGKYSIGGEASESFSTQCEACAQIQPSYNAQYEPVKQVTSDCSCVCNEDRPWVVDENNDLQTSCIVGDLCKSNFYYYFIMGVGGMNGFIGINVVVFLLFFVIMFRKRIYDVLFKRKKEEVFSRKFGTGVGSHAIDKKVAEGASKGKEKDAIVDDSTVGRIRRMRESSHRFIADDSDDVFNPVGRDSNFRESFIELTSYSSETKNPLQFSDEIPKADVDLSEKDRTRDFHFRAEQMDDETSSLKSTRILQLRMRLTDNDLPAHALRVYLHGTNHPNVSRGGCWKLPRSRPAALRPMLYADEYYKFVKKVNEITHWSIFCWETFLYAFFCICFPPFAPELLAKFRRWRGDALMKFINEYDHSCFKNSLQREKCDSIRIGISPCFTLAYIDFLYDKEESGENSPFAPLCPVGQAQLPASFRLAGLGTYFTPWYLDTNDLIVQAISQTDVPSCFIQATWINFVSELNNHFRQLQPMGLRHGLLRILSFLDKTNRSTELGGIIIELVTFSNTLPSESDSDKRRKIRTRRKAREARILADRRQGALMEIGALTSVESPSQSPMLKSSKSPSDNQIDTFSPSRRSLDTQVEDFMQDSSRITTGVSASGSQEVSNKLNTVPTITEDEEYTNNTNTSDSTHDNEKVTKSSTIKGSKGVHFPDSTISQSTDRSSFARESLWNGFDHRDSIAAVHSVLPQFVTNIISGGNKGGDNIKSDSERVDELLLDDRDNEEDRKTKVGCVRRFRRWLNFYGTTVHPMRASDPLGLTMNFEEMCIAVAAGKLCLGIQVTHEKVRSKKYIFDDDDYMSDSELEDNAKQERDKSKPTQSDGRSKNSVGEKVARGSPQGQDTAMSDTNLKAWEESVPLPLRSAGAGGMDLFPVRSAGNLNHEGQHNKGERRKTTADGPVVDVDDGLGLANNSAQASYGAHGNDMLKFYRIMLDAEGETEKQLQTSSDNASIAARALLQNMSSDPTSPISPHNYASGVYLSDTSGESSLQISPRSPKQRSPAKVPVESVLEVSENLDGGIVSFSKLKAIPSKINSNGDKKACKESDRTYDDDQSRSDESDDSADYQSLRHANLPKSNTENTTLTSPRAAASLKLFGANQFGSKPSSARSSFSTSFSGILEDEKGSSTEILAEDQPKRARVFMQDEIIGQLARGYEIPLERDREEKQNRAGNMDHTDTEKAHLVRRNKAIEHSIGFHQKFYRLVLDVHESDSDDELISYSGNSNTSTIVPSVGISTSFPAPASKDIRQSILTLIVQKVNEARNRVPQQLQSVEEHENGDSKAPISSYIDKDGALQTGFVPKLEAVSIAFPYFPNYLSFQTFARHFDLSSVLSEVSNLSQQPSTSQQRLQDQYQKHLLASSAYQTPVNAWRLLELGSTGIAGEDDVGQFNMGYGDNGFAGVKDLHVDKNQRSSMTVTNTGVRMNNMETAIQSTQFVLKSSGAKKRPTSDGLLTKRAFLRAYDTGRLLVEAQSKSKEKKSQVLLNDSLPGKKSFTSLGASVQSSTSAKNTFTSISGEGHYIEKNNRKQLNNIDKNASVDAFGNEVVRYDSESDSEGERSNNSVRQLASRVFTPASARKANKLRTSLFVASSLSTSFNDTHLSSAQSATNNADKDVNLLNEGHAKKKVSNRKQSKSTPLSEQEDNDNNEGISSLSDSCSSLRRTNSDSNLPVSTINSISRPKNSSDYTDNLPWYYNRHIARVWRKFWKSVAILRDICFHSLTVYYITRLLFGSNQRPRFKKYSSIVRLVVSFAMFMLSVVDAIIYLIIYYTGLAFFCPAHLNTGDNCTKEQSRPYLLYVLIIWPGAIFFAVIGGVLTYLMNLKPKYSRMAISYTRLAGISIISIVAMFLYFDPANQAGNFLTYTIYALSVSHVIQLTLMDQYVAHVECTRWTYGWDGLMTSLFITQDNRKDIAVSSKFATFNHSLREKKTDV